MKRRRPGKKMTDVPTIYGVLSDRKLSVPRGLTRRLVARAGNAVLLPFHVERRSLRNVVRCMRLMDIQGLIIDGGHQRALARILPRLDASAAAAGAVDTLIRRGAEFVGVSAAALACGCWLTGHLVAAHGRDRDALLAGAGEWMAPLAASLLERGWRVTLLAGPQASRAPLPRGVRALSTLPKGFAPRLVIVGRIAAAPRRRIAAFLETLRNRATLVSLGNGGPLETARHRTIELHLEKMTAQTYDTCVELLTNRLSPTLHY